MSEYKITKEKILKAAEECCDAKKVLKSMFPEAFEEGFVLTDKVDEEQLSAATSGMIQVYGSLASKYDQKSFFLSGHYDWEIKLDQAAISGAPCQILIPTPKK